MYASNRRGNNATLQINGRNSDIISTNSTNSDDAGDDSSPTSSSSTPEYRLQKFFAQLDYRGSLSCLSAHPEEAQRWIVALLPLHLLSYYITTANENDLFDEEHHHNLHQHQQQHLNGEDHIMHDDVDQEFMEQPPLLAVFSTLINVYPVAAMTPCRARGWLPLHYLSHMSTMRIRRKHIYCQLLSKLIASNPTMVTVTTSDDQGFGPLHLLLSDPDDFPPRSFMEMLIRPSPRAVVTMSNFGGGTSAIDLFYSNFCLDSQGTFSWSAPVVRRYLDSYGYNYQFRNARHTVLYHNAIRWEIALMLFHAAYTNQLLGGDARPYEEVQHVVLPPMNQNDHDDSMRNPTTDAAVPAVFRPLHALAGVADTPLNFMKFGLKVHRQHILNVDEGGNTLLHIAAKCDRDGREDNRQIIQCILEAEPRLAEISDADGAYPLTVALERRMEWNHGVKDICEAAPCILSHQDSHTCLVPFMFAASTYVKGEDDYFLNWAALDNTWEMLRADPSQIQSFHFS